jgi:hypothetical protein
LASETRLPRASSLPIRPAVPVSVAQNSASTPASPSTSATLAARGSAAATRTPTVCCASTSPSAATSELTPKPTSTPSPQNSTTVLDRPSAGCHHPKHSTRRCDDHLRPQAFGAKALRTRLSDTSGVSVPHLCPNACHAARFAGQRRLVTVSGVYGRLATTPDLRKYGWDDRTIHTVRSARPLTRAALGTPDSAAPQSGRGPVLGAA